MMNKTKEDDNSLVYWTLTAVPIIVMCMTVILTIMLRLAIGEFKCRHYINKILAKVCMRLVTLPPQQP